MDLTTKKVPNIFILFAREMQRYKKRLIQAKINHFFALIVYVPQEPRLRPPRKSALTI